MEASGTGGPDDTTQQGQAPPPPSDATQQGQEPPPSRGFGYGGGTMGPPWQGARMPIPGNAEWALWFLVEILFAIIWASSDAVDAADFVTATAVITFAYLISRGIAKASRVLEH
jgi:hypothetical protein